MAFYWVDFTLKPLSYSGKSTSKQRGDLGKLSIFFGSHRSHLHDRKIGWSDFKERFQLQQATVYKSQNLYVNLWFFIPDLFFFVLIIKSSFFKQSNENTIKVNCDSSGIEVRADYTKLRLWEIFHLSTSGASSRFILEVTGLLTKVIKAKCTIYPTCFSIRNTNGAFPWMDCIVIFISSRKAHIRDGN